MTERPRDDLYVLEELHQLVVARSEGTLAEAGFSRLEQLVLGHPLARDVFARYMLQTAGLRAWATSLAGGSGALAARPVSTSPIVRTFFMRVVPTTYQLIRDERVFSWVAAAIILFGIIGGASMLMRTRSGPVDGLPGSVAQRPDSSGQEQSDQGQSHPEQLEQQNAATERRSAARVSRVYDAEWGQMPPEDDKGADSVHARTRETLPPQFDLFPGDRLDLQRGLTEIEFATGAKVVLEGPATLSIDGANFCRLSMGKLVARVETESSKGFAVETPTATIVDLGTEFGVAVSGSETSLAVQRGAVEIQPRLVSGGGEKVGQAVHVSAGQSARVARGGKVVTSRSGASVVFTRSVPRPARRGLQMSVDAIPFGAGDEIVLGEGRWVAGFNGGAGSSTVVIHGMRFEPREQIGQSAAAVKIASTAPVLSPEGNVFWQPNVNKLFERSDGSPWGGQFHVTVAGLTPGKTYRVQFFCGQGIGKTPASARSREMVIESSGVATPRFSATAGGKAMPMLTAKRVVAEFIAERPTQEFTFRAAHGNARANLAAACVSILED